MIDYETAQQIRKAYSRKRRVPVTQRDLALRFGTSQKTIHRILNYETFQSPRRQVKRNSAPVIARLTAAGLHKIEVWVYADDLPAAQALCQRHRHVFTRDTQ